MDFGQPLAAFVHKYFMVSKLSGHEKVTIVCALLAQGIIGKPVGTALLTKSWSRTVLKASYSGTFLARAQQHGWLRSEMKGQYTVTEDGIDHLLAIQKLGDLSTAPQSKSELRLFATGQTHSFDKYLRGVLAGAGASVRIADSYVDGTIFDNLLDQIPKIVKIQLMYGKSYDSYDTRAKRFKTEFPKFTHKNNPNFHDRLLIIDSAGYVLGPSLKDAAYKTPASVVRLNSKDSEQIIKFFDGIWKSV
jgi:hypothetical protein